MQPGKRLLRPLSILVLADDNPGHADTVLDHIDSFRRYSRHAVTVFNPRGLQGSRFLRLPSYDVVVVHYSLIITNDSYLGPGFRESLHRYDGLKIQFIQDEYRWIDEITDAMDYLGIDVVFSAAAEADLPHLYTNRLPGLTAITTLTGYLPDRMLGMRTPAIHERPIDVGYRGRVVPYSLGALGQEKVGIAKGFLERAARLDLRCDIAWREEDRIYGPAWNGFIASCRTMLGTESGASIADFDGSIERRVNEYLAEHPDATFEEVSERELAPHEGNLEIRAVSPRVFEAVASRTALIQFPGDYSGVVRPWEHYIPLEKDFSNMDDVAERIRDERFLGELIERAYADVAASGRYSYRAFIEEFDEVVDAYGRERGLSGVRPSPRLRSLEMLVERLAVAEARIRPSAITTQRLSHLRIWTGVRHVARMCVLLRASLPYPALRRLLEQALRDPSVRRIVTDGTLPSDVLRLAALAGASSNPGQRGFRPTAHFDPDDGRLRFTSRPLTDTTPSDVAWADVRSAIVAGQLEHVIWSHAAIDNAFTLPLLGPKSLRFYVGRENPSVHVFDCLLGLSPRYPELIADALESAIEAQAPRLQATLAEPK